MKNINIELGGINKKDILLFTKHLAITIKSGITIIEALEMLAEETKGKMKKIILDIKSNIESGQSFHNSLKKHKKYFSAVYINMIKTGEFSGRLEENLSYLARELEKSAEMRQKVKSAMLYPIIVLAAVFILGFSISIFVLPKIVPLFYSLDVELPITTRILIGFASLFQNHSLTIIALSIASVSLLIWVFRVDFLKPFTHKILLKLPFFKHIIRDINLQRFTHTFSSLLKSGIPLRESLSIIIDSTENRVYKKSLQSILLAVENGNSLHEALFYQEKLFPKITRGMISVGEKSGELDSSLDYLSEMFENEINNTMKNLASILEPILLIFIGVVVGFVAISILGPIYKITGNLRN